MKEEIKRNLLIVNSRDKKSGTNSDFIYSLGDNSLEIEAVSLKSVVAAPEEFIFFKLTLGASTYILN